MVTRTAAADVPSRPWERPLVATGVLALLVVVTAAGPDPVPIAGARLVARAALVAGAAVLVARARAVDLGAGAIVGVGAVVGAVVPSLAGVPALFGLPLGAAGGAVLGALHGALIGRTGRQLGALVTLASGAAIVQVLGTLDLVGGVAGFHAVGLPTGAGDRADALIVGVLAGAAVLTAGAVCRSRLLAAAAVATADGAAASALGRSPVADVAVAGALGGALLGGGGAMLAAVEGSVVPGAYGLSLTAALLLAAALGGAGTLGPVVGVVVVWGPATVLPLVPVVGTSPVLVVAGPLALAVLAWRGGRPVVPHRGPVAVRRPWRRPAPDRARPSPSRDSTSTVPALRLRGTPTPVGPVDLDVHAGEIVAVTGRNGSGKSTLLARIGGQLPDDGTIEIAGAPAPRGARRRALAGVARTWQRPPALDPVDADVAVTVRPTRIQPPPSAGTGADTDAGPGTVASARAELGGAASTPSGAQLLRVVASRPAVALIDEPTDLPPGAVASVLARLAADGAAVVLVDHRPEVFAAAHRRYPLIPDGPAAAAPEAAPSADPAPAGEGRPSVEVRPRVEAPAPVRLRARATAAAGTLDLALPPGAVVRLPDDAATVRWFARPTLTATGDLLEVDGRDLLHRSARTRVRHGLVVVGDPPIAPEVSVHDHLAAAAPTGRVRRLLADLPTLAGRGRDPVGVLSGGERRLVGWARAVLLGPAVVVMDRAGTGLDDGALRWAHAQVDRWRGDGVTVLVRVGRAAEVAWVLDGPDAGGRSRRGHPRPR